MRRIISGQPGAVTDAFYRREEYSQAQADKLRKKLDETALIPIRGFPKLYNGDNLGFSRIVWVGKHNFDDTMSFGKLKAVGIKATEKILVM